MTWTDHLNRVIQEQAKLVQSEWRTRFDTIPVQDTEQWLEERDEAVDQSIEYFLQTGQWGELSRDDQPDILPPDPNERGAWALSTLYTNISNEDSS
ncbi:MAG: hypothetical protein QOG67_178 [Verrucomicrobiota bacterium]|jgi:hypothetical protein